MIPAISQLVVNKSSLVLVSASVLQPRPDSIQLTLLSALDLKLALPVRIEPITLSLYVRDTGANHPWGQVGIPGLTIRGNTTLGAENQPTPLLNETVWTDYVHDVVFQNETALSVKGTTNSYLGVLKSKVTMNKDIVSPSKLTSPICKSEWSETAAHIHPALNQFEGFGISDSTLLIPARDDGTNLIGNATLPNPSVLTLEIGTIILDIKSGDLVIGNATLENLIIKPGNNVVPLTAILDIPTILKNLGNVLKTQASALRTGNLTLDTISKSVTWNGTLVPYYTDAMSKLTLTANVPIVTTLRNTIKNLLGGSDGKNLTEIIQSLNDSGSSSNGDSILADLRQGIDQLEGNDDSSGGSSTLATALKRNIHVRDIFRDEHPVKRDAMIESLAGWYTKHE